MDTIEGNNGGESVRVERLYVSPGHNFVGHHGQPPGTHPMLEVPMVECVAGRGLRGDRYFDFKEKYKGQITFFARETYEAICRELNIHDKPSSTFRRNVITAGVDLNALVGREFQIQGLRFRGTEQCRPCHWMDRAFGPGAFEFLKGRGGLRALILSDGVLRPDPEHASNVLAEPDSGPGAEFTSMPPAAQPHETR